MAVDYTKLLDGNSLKAIKSYVDNTFLKNYGSNPQSPAATITQPDGSNAVSMRSGATSGRDIGIFRLSDDNAYICNSSDNNYLFATFDTDRTLDFSSADNAAFVVLSDHAGVKMKGNLTVSGTITANGQAVILNDDSRLSNARPASDVYAWAKESTKPSYSFSEISNRGEAFLEWGGRSLVGGFAPIDAALVSKLSANRVAGISGDAITIERSSNGGSTWTTDTSITAAEKKAFFTTGNWQHLRTGSTCSPIDRLRITMNATDYGVYTSANKIMMYVSTNGSSGCTVYIDTEYYAYPGQWHEVGTFNLAGWSGWNVLNFNLPGSGALGGSNSDYHNKRIRFTFACTGVDATYTGGLEINCAYIFGGVGWSTPSTLATNGVPYDYDADGNIFCASIYENGTALSSKYAAKSHTHTKSEITDFPTNMPANGGTADYIWCIGAGPDSAFVGGKLSAFYSWNAGGPVNSYSIGLTLGGHPSDPYYGWQIAQSLWDDDLYYRRRDQSTGSFRSWLKVLNPTNGLSREGWWNESDSHSVNDLGSGITFAYTTHGTPTTGTLVSLAGIGGSCESYRLQIQGGYSQNRLYFRNRNGDNGTWGDWREVIHSGNIGSQSVNYANSAGSAPASDVYAWAKASTKPSYNLDEVTDGSTRKLSNYVTLAEDQNITGTKTFINQIKFKTSANSTNEQLTISLIDVGSGIGYSKLLFDGCSYLEFHNMQLSLSILSLGTLMGNYQTVHGSSIECLWLGNSEGGGLNLISPYNTDGAISFRTNNSDSGITQYKLKVPSTVGYTSDRTIATTADIPTSLPASDVYAWAKASTKPSYNLDEVTDGSTRKLDNYLSKSGGTMGGNITLGSGASGQTQVGASLVMGIQNDSYGLLPYSDNWNQIGADGRRWYRAYISNVYGTTIYENGTSLVNKYLGKSDQAADSAKLGGVAASSYATQSWAQGLMTPTAVGQGQTKSNVNGYNGATFTIGTSGYNGIYIFTYGNCFVFLPIYGITANKEYKIAASLVNSAGSYTCKVLTYRYVSSSGTLQIYQKENYIPTGYGCALFKVKLY